jgi:hypothetical protein
MPFPHQDARPFTRPGIEWLAPDQIGVYGIFREDACIYIGRGDLRGRLLAHLNGDNPRITRERPTYYLTAVTNDEVNKEKAFIIEFDPIANRKIG